MRTNVVIDDTLVRRALKLGGLRSRRAAIEAGLRLLVQVNSQKRLRRLRGMISLEGDLNTMRKD